MNSNYKSTNKEIYRTLFIVNGRSAVGFPLLRDFNAFIPVFIWDILNDNITEATKELAKNLVSTYENKALNPPDLAKAIAEWNLNYPPDGTLIALIDELISSITPENQSRFFNVNTSN